MMNQFMMEVLKNGAYLTPMGVFLAHAAMRIAVKRPGRLWNVSVKIIVSATFASLLLSFMTSEEEEEEGENDAGSVWEYMIPRMIQFSLGFCLGLHVGESVLPVALTGSIATGKSTTAQLLQTPSDLGSIYLIDLDKIAHDILLPNSSNSVYTQVIQAFAGYDILQESGPSPRLIDRPKLGAVVFSDPAKRRTLNRITHRMIRTVMLKEIVKNSFQYPVVCVDVPLLYEAGMALRILFGIEIVVACTPSLQFKRLCERNPDLTEDQCRQRIESQMTVDRKAQMADIVIWNNGTQQELTERVAQVRQDLFDRIHGGKPRLRLSLMVFIFVTIVQLYRFLQAGGGNSS